MHSSLGARDLVTAIPLQSTEMEMWHPELFQTLTWMHIRATRLETGTGHVSLPIFIVPFCLIPSLYILYVLLFCYTVCVCNKKHPSSSVVHQPQCHSFHLLLWIFLFSAINIGLNYTFGRDSKMYIRIERGRKWPSRWDFMHYRSLYEWPESHSATINQDEGPTGPLPARM